MYRMLHTLKYSPLIISLVFGLSSIAMAQPAGPPMWVAQAAPETYVVREGDTLWGIACIFLKDPWRWQEVWESNPNIMQPNRIYPGDKLYLNYVEGRPRIQAERGKTWETLDKRTGIVKLRPRVRSYPAESPIPTIALNVIGPFLNASRVVDQCDIDKAPVIIALEEDHIVVGTGDRIFVSGVPSNDRNDVYAIFRPGKDYIDPNSKRNLGIEGIMLGKAEREVVADPSRWILTQSFSEIKVGDRLINTLEQEIEAYFVPKAPQKPADGSIISVFDGITQIGQYQIIVVTGGHDRCREVGDVLAIIQSQKDIPSRFLFQAKKKYKFPLMNIGQCMVFRVFDKVSYALVMNAIRPIYLLDGIASP